jgi:hypothetical protein
MKAHKDLKGLQTQNLRDHKSDAGETMLGGRYKHLFGGGERRASRKWRMVRMGCRKSMRGPA